MDTTVLPAARKDLLDATEVLLRSAETVELAAGDDHVALPDELRHLLADVVKAMRRGQAVTVAPVGRQLTTQQAADLLGISRPTLVKLLEAGEIPYEQPGRHRRVKLTDLLDFQRARSVSRRESLRELAQDAQDLGLYDTAPTDLVPALAEARRKLA